MGGNLEKAASDNCTTALLNPFSLTTQKFLEYGVALPKVAANPLGDFPRWGACPEIAARPVKIFPWLSAFFGNRPGVHC
jgi:hypothetical protein